MQIDNVKLVEAGRLREAEMLELLAGGTYPSRNPQQNLADLKAQIAANEKGVQELRKMVAQFGLEVLERVGECLGALEVIAVRIGRQLRDERVPFAPDGRHIDTVDCIEIGCIETWAQQRVFACNAGCLVDAERRVQGRGGHRRLLEEKLIS